MMTADAFSDAILALTTVLICYFQRQRNCAYALAHGVIALAAALGVLHFSGWLFWQAPHDFFSLVAGVAAVPMLAASLMWPGSLLTTQRRAAWIFLLCFSALGVLAVVVLTQRWWQQVLPAIAMLGLLHFAWRQRDVLTWMAVGFLLSAFLVSALQWQAGIFSTVQLLHYLMSLGLLQLSTAITRQKNNLVLAQ